MEGAPVKLKNDQYIDTSNVLFICGGAFVGLEKIMSKTHGFGFIATSADDNQNILDRLNKRVKPTDLFEFGLIPEFTGRLPVIANLHPLTKAMLVSIMSVPKNSIYRQYIEIFRGEGVELSIGPRVFEQIAEIAIEYKTGARSLRGIFEELITPILYVVPDKPEICKVEIRSLFEDAQPASACRPAHSGDSRVATVAPLLASSEARGVRRARFLSDRTHGNQHVPG
jgi:ATP-dependent Clp protease ATP-binding subunit ClpX